MTLEEAQSKILELEEAVQAKDETITSLNILQEDNQKKLSDYESQIQTLKEHNMNLFLRVSQEPASPIPADEDPGQNAPAVRQDWEDFMQGW